jgi:outer membrane biosynthesis protein TonB
MGRDGQMATPNKPRVPTMRLSRPYGTEDELIEGDFASIGRPWIILPNVPVLPVGEVVRFEVLLSNGAPAIRGEGVVVAYHAPGAGPKPPGLEVKFTRMDARTKTIIERVHARRLALGRSASRPPPVDSTPPPVEAAPATPETTPTPPEAAPATPETTPTPPEAAPATPETTPTPPEAAPPPVEAAPTAPDAAPSPVREIAAPSNRDELLERLRERARNLPADKRFTGSQRGA